MIAAMRPDIDNIDEYVRNTTARAFSVVASALGIPALLPFLKAVCLSKKSWQVRARAGGGRMLGRRAPGWCGGAGGGGLGWRWVRARCAGTLHRAALRWLRRRRRPPDALAAAPPARPARPRRPATLASRSRSRSPS
jgi:hypothetical protein